MIDRLLQPIRDVRRCLWHMEIPNYATVYRSAGTDISPGFHL